MPHVAYERVTFRLSQWTVLLQRIPYGVAGDRLFTKITNRINLARGKWPMDADCVIVLDPKEKEMLGLRD